MSFDMSHLVEFKNFRFDPENKTLWQDGDMVPISPKAMEVLSVLIAKRGNLVERETILNSVWQDIFVEDGNLNHAILALRKALGDDVIKTIPRRGYRFTAEVKPVEPVPENRVVIERRSVSETTIEENEEISPLLSGSENRRSAARWPVKLLFSSVAVILIAATFWVWRGTQTSAITDTANIKALAVIPFSLIGENEGDAILARGIEENLAQRLGGFKDLAIRPRTSIEVASRNEENPLEIGRKLKVDSVLMGSFQRAADRIRLSVRLLKVSDGTQLWAETFDEKEQDVFSLQDSLSAQAAKFLTGELTLRQSREESKRPTEDIEAYKLYMRGRYEWTKRTDDGFRKSVESFRAAIDRDPSFANAYAGLADAYALLADYNLERPSDAFPKAKAAAYKALELDKSLAQPRTTLAYILATYDWNYAEAEREYRLSIQDQPLEPNAHQWYGELLYALKRYSEADVELKIALELNPLVPITQSEVGAMLYYMGRLDESLARMTAVSKEHPTFGTSHIFSAWIFDQKQMPDESFEEEIAYWRLNGADAKAIEVLTKAYQTGGRNAFLTEATAQYEKKVSDGAFPSYKIVHTYARLQNREKTLEWIEKCLKERSPNIIKISSDPNFEFLQDDPRFRTAIAQLKLPS
jgi:DNA-binding winged helix-turn-helix (wHTH) protein/TolB-like protein